MADTPTVNQPASGTYGEQAELEKLKQSLPAGAVGQPPAPTAAPPAPLSTDTIAPPSTAAGRPPSGAAIPPGISSAIFAPTQHPEVPGNTPLAPTPAGPLAGAQTPAQGRLLILDMLANNPDVSPATREWAQMMVRALVGS